MYHYLDWVIIGEYDKSRFDNKLYLNLLIKPVNTYYKQDMSNLLRHIKIYFESHSFIVYESICVELLTLSELTC